jgi:hypothetical protein
MIMNVRSPSVIRHHPGFIRDREWTINGPMVDPAQTPHRWPTDNKRTPMERRDRDIEWPVQDRRTPRMPVPEPEDDGFPYISPKQPATCWLI